MVEFTIPGAPRTKKNHSRIVWSGNRPRLLPSEAHEEWFNAAIWTIKPAIIDHHNSLPIRCDVNVTATFYRDRNTGDANGYYQALADLLEKAGVVENDRQIVSWDGSRLRKDAENPRIEVSIQEVVE